MSVKVSPPFLFLGAFLGPQGASKNPVVHLDIYSRINIKAAAFFIIARGLEVSMLVKLDVIF